MSNASNLSTLANVLDDGSDGQFLKSTGSGGVAFDTVAAGAVVYATADLLPLSGNSAGDMAYVTATNRFYINNGSGWYSVSLVNTNPNITSVVDAVSNTTPFTLATDGTATVITVTAADPEDVPLTYGYSVTSGSLNGSTVSQGTGSNTNVFTVTPHASQDAAFTLTFTASDGINQATSDNEFSLSFITIVTDSNHTTLLATATGTSDNNNITDSSSNSHSITVNNDTYAGTFSPYRSGGYSIYLPSINGGSEHNISFDHDAGFNFGSGDFTIEFSVYFPSNSTATDYLFQHGESTGSWNVNTSNGVVSLFLNGIGIGNDVLADSSNTISNNLNKWIYYAIVRSGTTVTMYRNGTSIATKTSAQNANVAATLDTTNSEYLHINRRRGGIGDGTEFYFKDFRVTKGLARTITAITEPLTSDVNTSILVGNLPYIGDASSNSHTATYIGSPSIKLFSPYDYNEYSATDHGGSVYFDGNLDDISVAGSSDFAPSTSQFTIKLWYYPKVQSTGATFLVRQGTSTSTVGYWAIAHYSSGRIRRMQNVGGSFNGAYSANNVIKIGQWNYIEFYQNGASTGEIKVNGVSVLTGANYVGNTDDLQFGSSSNSDADLFISDIQIVKGSDGRESSVPTAPMSSVSNTKLHIKGTDASIIDKSQGSNLKLVGNTTGSTTTNFTGAKSIDLTGSTDYLVAESEDILTQDYTIETWIYAPTGGFTATGYVFDTRPQTNTQNGISLYINNNTAQLRINGNTKITSGTTLSDQNWHHVALSRSGSNTKLFFNGSQTGSTYTVLDSILSPKFFLGIQSYNTSAVNGVNAYLQDFRITKGLARYTANFTPPTAPLEG